MKWPEGKLMKFIDLYEMKECLWNNKRETYKNSLLKKTAMEDIVERMDFKALSVADVKDKIKTIRTLYRRELNKILKSEKSGCEIEDIYQPRLFWFKRVDSFLRPVTLSRGYGAKYEFNSNTAEDKLDYEEYDEEPQDNWNAENLIEIKDTKPQILPDLIELNTNIPTNFKPQPARSSKSTQFTETGFFGKQKKIKNVREDTSKELENRCSQSEEELEEFRIFGQSVGVQLRKLPLHRAVFCRQKIQDFLSAERLAFLNASSSMRQFPPISSYYSSDPPTTLSQYAATSLDITENVLTPQYHSYPHPLSDYSFPHVNRHVIQRAKSTQVSNTDIVSESMLDNEYNA